MDEVLPPKPRASFYCRCCGRDPDCPIIHDELWAQASGSFPRQGEKKDLLCTACVERLLDRQLTVDDLKRVVGNSFTFLLVERLRKAQ